MRVGVISDTHSLLRPEAVAALQGVDRILHAGDVGDIRILDRLGQVAPVTAIRGNIDRIGECALLPPAEWINLDGISLYMIHDLHELDLDPAAAGLTVVISGHTHKPKIEWREREGKRVLYFNPGSAGPRRFSLPISIGFLEIEGGQLKPELVELDL
jgi:putative phosphoesterase